MRSENASPLSLSGCLFHVFVLLLEAITVFLEAFKKVKFFGKDLAHNCQLIDADKVCAHKIYRLISLPAIVPSLFLNMVRLGKFGSQLRNYQLVYELHHEHL
jgi:hypothetical protein